MKKFNSEMQQNQEFLGLVKKKKVNVFTDIQYNSQYKEWSKWQGYIKRDY